MTGKILLDLHTHIIASGHAYSTMQEMAARDSEIGLEILGITEHGPSIPGTCDPLYIIRKFEVPKNTTI